MYTLACLCVQASFFFPGKVLVHGSYVVYTLLRLYPSHFLYSDGGGGGGGGAAFFSREKLSDS